MESVPGAESGALTQRWGESVLERRGRGRAVLGVLGSELGTRGTLTAACRRTLSTASSLGPLTEATWVTQLPACFLPVPLALCTASPHGTVRSTEAGPSQAAGQPFTHTRPESVSGMQLLKSARKRPTRLSGICPLHSPASLAAC